MINKRPLGKSREAEVIIVRQNGTTEILKATMTGHGVVALEETITLLPGDSINFRLPTSYILEIESLEGEMPGLEALMHSSPGKLVLLGPRVLRSDVIVPCEEEPGAGEES